MECEMAVLLSAAVLQLIRCRLVCIINLAHFVRARVPTHTTVIDESFQWRCGSTSTAKYRLDLFEFLMPLMAWSITFTSAIR